MPVAIRPSGLPVLHFSGTQRRLPIYLRANSQVEIMRMQQERVMKQRKARNIAGLTTLVAALWVMLAVTPGYAQPAPGKKVPARAAATAAAPAGEAQLRGIWEPVNYKEDIRFNDVFFVTPEEGWVAGQFATILHTTDGGQTWTVQLGGDPQSQEAEIGMLRFLDQRHGWAAQGQKLLATSDGENWLAVGN